MSKNYIILNDKILSRPDLNADEKILFGLIGSPFDNRLYLTVPYISKRLGWSAKKVRQNIDSIIAKCLICIAPEDMPYDGCDIDTIQLTPSGKELYDGAGSTYHVKIPDSLAGSRAAFSQRESSELKIIVADVYSMRKGENFRAYRKTNETINKSLGLHGASKSADRRLASLERGAWIKRERIGMRGREIQLTEKVIELITNGEDRVFEIYGPGALHSDTRAAIDTEPDF